MSEPTQEQEELKPKQLSIKQNMAWNTVGSLFYQGCQWLTTVLVVLLLPGYEGSGTLALAMALGNVFFVFATYNMRTFQVSDIRGEFSSGDYVGFRLLTMSTAYIACALYTIGSSPSPSSMAAITAYLLFKADESFVVVLYAIDQKASRMDLIGISQMIRGVITLAAFGGMLYATSSLIVAIISMTIGCAFVTIFYDLRKSKQIDSVRPSASKKTCWTLARRCLPVVAAPLLYCLVATVVRQYFGLLYGEGPLGVYAAVATPCVLVQALAGYLYAPFLTPLAERWSRDNQSNFVRLFVKAVRAVLVVSGVCIFCAVLFGASLVELVFGESIQGDSWMVVPAMIAACLMAVDLFLTDIFVMLRKPLFAVVINAIALIVCLSSMNQVFDLYYSNGINIELIVSFAISSIVGIVILVRILLGRSSRTALRAGMNN